MLCEGVLIAIARCGMGTCGDRCSSLPCGSDCFLMRATAGDAYNFSKVVDLYDSGTGRWSTAQLSQARFALSATSVGTVAIFAGGFGYNGLLLRILFLFCARKC